MKLFILVVSLPALIAAAFVELLQWGLKINLQGSTMLMVHLTLLVSVVASLVLLIQDFSQPRTYTLIDQTKYDGHRR